MSQPSDYVVTASAQRVLATRIGTGIALLDIDSSAYFSLDEVGAFVWEYLQKPATLQQVVEAVSGQYDIDAADCASDIQALLDDLLSANLLEAAVPAEAG